MDWNVDPDQWPHTPPMPVWRAQYEADSNLVWRAGTGHVVNMLDAALERLEAVEALHHRRPHTANGGNRSGGGFDFVAHGQQEFPDLCDHCQTMWPCPTARALEGTLPAAAVSDPPEAREPTP